MPFFDLFRGGRANPNYDPNDPKSSPFIEAGVVNKVLAGLGNVDDPYDDAARKFAASRALALVEDKLATERQKEQFRLADKNDESSQGRRFGFTKEELAIKAGQEKERDSRLNTYDIDKEKRAEGYKIAGEGRKEQAEARADKRKFKFERKSLRAASKQKQADKEQAELDESSLWKASDSDQWAAVRDNLGLTDDQLRGLVVSPKGYNLAANTYAKLLGTRAGNSNATSTTLAEARAKSLGAYANSDMNNAVAASKHFADQGYTSPDDVDTARNAALQALALDNQAKAVTTWRGLTAPVAHFDNTAVFSSPSGSGFTLSPETDDLGVATGGVKFNRLLNSDNTQLNIGPSLDLTTLAIGKQKPSSLPASTSGLQPPPKKPGVIAIDPKIVQGTNLPPARLRSVTPIPSQWR